MELVRIDIIVTQIIGFLIVLWVLKRYAWGPVLGMLEERRSKISRDVADAEKLHREAESLKAEYARQLETIEAQARVRIQEAVAEGQRMAEEIRAEAQAETRRLAERAKAELELEYKKARSALRGDMVGLALGAAEKLMGEQLGTEEHRRLVDRFLTELEAKEKTAS
jgi:F-type H+-transporting ATPase subunit b